MGFFDFIKSKSSSQDYKQNLIDIIIGRFFNGSKEKLHVEVKDLLEVTKFSISFEQMSALLLCCLGYHGTNSPWDQKILNHLKQLCSGKLPDVELKWLYDYCDLHYIHKNPSKEFLLLSEMAGRQIGMPAPHEFFSKKETDTPKKVSESVIKSSIEELKENFDFNKSFKKHALTLMMLRPGATFMYFAKKNMAVPLWVYDGNIYCDQEDSSTMGVGGFMWLMQKYQQQEDFCWTLDFLDRQYADLWPQASKNPNVLVDEIKRYLPNFKLSNNPESIEASLQWAWIDLQSILRFIEFCTSNSASVLFSTKVVNNLRECSTIEELVRLFLSDFNVTLNGLVKSSEEKTDLSEEDRKREEAARKKLAEIEKDEKNTTSSNEKSNILKSWSLAEFSKIHGKMKYIPEREYTSVYTGEKFRTAACAFVHPTELDEQGRQKVTFVWFANKLGQLTPEQIVARQKELIIVQTDAYVLTQKTVDNDLDKKNYLYNQILECARKLLHTLEDDCKQDLDKKLLQVELTILSAASIWDIINKKNDKLHDFIENKIFNDYLSIKDVGDYDYRIERNTPGMCINDLYIMDEGISLEEFEKINGQVKFLNGIINAYPYDDNFWGEFIGKDGKKKIIYVDQGFQFEYTLSNILNNKQDYGIVEEKDIDYHGDDIVYCLKKIKKKHSMLPSYISDRLSFYMKAIEYATLNRQNLKSYSFLIYNAVTNEMLNGNGADFGDFLEFDNDIVFNNQTGVQYSYNAICLNNFSKCIWTTLNNLRQELNEIIISIRP